MKKNIFGYGFIALIFLFPFRYALLEPTSSNVVNLLSIIATIIGLLIFMGVMMDNGKEEAVAEVAAETNNHKQAA